MSPPRFRKIFQYTKKHLDSIIVILMINTLPKDKKHS